MAEVFEHGLHARKPSDALHRPAKIPYGPGKAVNAGGVATSGLEMTQNSHEDQLERGRGGRRQAARDHVVDPPRLRPSTAPSKDGYVNYMKGANIAGFMKVAKSMVEQGVI